MRSTASYARLRASGSLAQSSDVEHPTAVRDEPAITESGAGVIDRHPFKRLGTSMPAIGLPFS